MPTRNEGGTLMAKLTQQPLLLQPGCEDLFAQSIVEMQMHPQFTAAMDVSSGKMQTDDFWADDDDFISWLRPYNVENGVLTIPVTGVLMNKVSITFGSYATGYTYIERAHERGMEDPEVHTIAFAIDSPGGEVAGNFALAEKIAASRGEKSMIAFADDHAYSAAYSIATAADEIVLARSGGVGSVGVVTAHMDMSKRMEQMGVKVTFIYAGAHKVDGNPYEALPAATKERIQERIDRIYGEFVSLVAENRGMDEEAVRATEALTYDASNAVDIGFADRIGAMNEELAALSLAATEMEHSMAITTPKTPAAESGQITQAQMDAAVAAARTEGSAEGATAERTRTSAIMDSDEAKDRPTAARALADTGMDAAAAVTALGKMPKEEAAAPAPAPTPEAPKAAAPAPTPFAANMDGPEVGAQVDAPAADGKVSSNDLLAAHAAITGIDRREKKTA